MIGDKKEMEFFFFKTMEKLAQFRDRTSVLSDTIPLTYHCATFFWYNSHAGPNLSKLSQASAGYSLYKLFGWFLGYSILSYTKF
jgi:hypothetical protein